MTNYIQPPTIMLMGGAGSGKTYSISTLLELGLEVFVIVTEPVGVDSLVDACLAKRLPLDRLHWHQVTPSRASFDSLLEVAKKISITTYEQITKMPPSGNRRDAKWLELISTMANFRCDRDGKEYGPVDLLTGDRAVVVDSLSGLNVMAMDLTIGDKPTAHQGEWGIAMQTLEKFLNACTSNLKVPFVLTAHLEKETNEITGVQQIMASALGRKLAPRLPRFFSEVVMAYKEGENFHWSTTALNVDLKNRALPLSNKIKPHFGPIIQAYQKRLEATRASPST